MASMYAFCGLVFFIAFAVISVLMGGEDTVLYVAAFLFFAGVSQVAAQGETHLHYWIAIGSIIGAVLAGLMVIVTL